MPPRARPIPRNLQPDDREWNFDIETKLRSILNLRADIPGSAFTADSLGTERSGSAVAIEGGLVLTMGYLIIEAETIWLTTHDGRPVAGHVLAVDYDTGFGLVQPLGKLGVPELALGAPDTMQLGDPALLAAAGGRARAIETKLVGRQEFAGYWEYLIEDALFTAPAHPFWGGAAMIGADGKLLGICSLILQQGDDKGARVDMNMVVPVSLLRPRLTELTRYGKVNEPAKPWIGVFAMDDDDEVVIGGVADGGPAEQAGLRQGDRLISIEGEEIADIAGFWRKLWSLGEAGCLVHLSIGRDRQVLEVTLPSIDRGALLRAPRMH
jgi:S1-C subfamily serine protease